MFHNNHTLLNCDVEIEKQQKRKEERGEATLGQMMSACNIPQDQGLSLLPPRLIPVVSSDGRDTVSSSSPRDALQTILERATSVVASIDAESMLRNAPEAATASVGVGVATSTNMLADLEQAIGPDMDLTSNPFEPTPIKEDSLLLGDGDADLMDSISAQAQQQDDIIQVFDTLPTLDLRHALGA